MLDRNIYLLDDIEIEEIIKEEIFAINKQILELLFAYNMDNSKKELRDIMKIKVETEDEIIRYGCNILLESYNEA